MCQGSKHKRLMVFAFMELLESVEGMQTKQKLILNLIKKCDKH